jgi:hypothetical protein
MPRIARWRFVLLAVLLFETITWSAQDELVRLERLFEAASVDEGVATDPVAHFLSHPAPPSHFA